MRYLCNAESAIATCDSYNCHKKPKLKKTHKSVKLRRFLYADLEASTNGFSPRSLLGKGSHGAVFLAVLNNGAFTAAVKRSTASVTLTSENEIEILSKIRSRRIVNLIGYAVDSEKKKLLLVVEYMPNGSLYDLIHNNPKPPGWSNRVRLALQVAKAVRLLHGSNPPVIHRDIKSSNVLIDERGKARVSDFGLALMGHVEDVRVMSTPPAGTLGYLDPCYLAPGDLSTKSDVFSFGILLLEIISGRRAIDVNYSPPSIVEWALPLIKSGAYQKICDRRIRCPVDPTVSRQLAVLATRCVRSTAEKRLSMEEVVDCLKLIYKRVKAAAMLPIWNNLRRMRVRCEGRSGPLDDDDDDDDDVDGSDVEQQVRTSRHGSRRSLASGRNRKVSSVTRSTEHQSMVKIGMEVTRGGSRTCRSKSIGSVREMKVGPRKGPTQAVTVIMCSAVRLSKSRSVSVLQNSENNETQLNDNNGKKAARNNPEIDVFPLLVNCSSSTTTTTKAAESLK